MSKMAEASVVQMLVAGRNDLAWFESDLDRLKSEYNNKFIAFRDGNVIDSDTDVDRLMKKLEEKSVDTSNIFIKFVSKVKAIL